MKTAWALLLPIILAAGLGLWRLDSESVWHDEGWSIRAVNSPFLTPDDKTPVLYYFCLHLLQILGAGDSPFALRYGSVLIFALGVAVAGKLGRAWYGVSGGLLAGILYASLPLIWEYAQEVRAYITIPLYALLFLWGVERILRAPVKQKTPLIALISLAEVAALYSHNLSVPLVAWVNLILVPAAIYAGWRGERWPYVYLAAQALALLLYLPWLLSQAPSGTNINTVPHFDRQLSQDIWRGYLLPTVSDPDRLPRQWIAAVHVWPALIGLAGLILLWRGRNLRSGLILSQALLLPIFSTLLLQRASIDFHPRYYILMAPASILMLVAGAAHLGSLRWPASLALMGIGLGLSAYSLNFIADNRDYQQDDFAGLAAYYASLPPDTLILIPYDDEPAIQAYFAKQLPIQARFVNMPIYSDWESALALLGDHLAGPGPHRVELLTWFQLPADIRGMYPCLLAGLGRAEGPPRLFDGLQTQAFQLGETHPGQNLTLEPGRAWQAPLIPGDTPPRLWIGEEGLCLASTWGASLPPGQDYALQASLTTPGGWEISRADGPLLTARQENTARWSKNGAGAAWLWLPLPAGAYLPDYTLTLRLYSPQNPDGVDVLNPGGQFVGKTWPLVTPGPLSLGPISGPSRLLSDNAPPEGFYGGQSLRAQVLLSPEDSPAKFRLSGPDWEVGQMITPPGGAHLWLELTLPPTATGPARLWLNETPLGEYEVISLPGLWEAPPMQNPVGQTLGESLRLVAYTAEQGGGDLNLQLLWQAEMSLGGDYMVFVQLLSPEGEVLAQRDSQPMGGERPTNTWRPGEYILDSHPLKLDGLYYTGEARLILGMYDPQTGQRLLTPGGADFIPLPLEFISER
jgi:hypothetical protein